MSQMETNPEILTLDQSLVFKNVDQHSSSIRTVQTNLSNQQFADKGLMIFAPSRSGKAAHQFIGSDQSWDSPHPILISASQDYSDLFIDRHADPVPKQVAWLPQFEARVSLLDETANEDEIQISLASRTDVEGFVKRLFGVRQPSVFLSGNGNFRLRWKNAQGEKVGLQFRGDGDVQYIFFKQVGDKTEYMLGIKLVSTVEAFITACGMRHLIVE
jgi:hypothetical protein